MSARARKCVECGRVGRNAGGGLCGACYARQYRRDPANAAKARRVSRAWKDAHREENRARDRAYGMSEEQRGECSICGGPMGSSAVSKGHASCAGCVQAAADLKRQIVTEMWARGARMPEICAALGWSIGRLSMEMHRMRELGYALPYRSRLRSPRFPDQVVA